MVSQFSQATIQEEFPVADEISHFYPFVPVKEDYALEIGSMWEASSLYWMGASIGMHTGRCIFSQSQTCQQYIDVIGGAGGRDGLTLGVVMGGLRWQYVNFPSGHSPSIKLLGGLMNIREKQRNRFKSMYGVGFALTSSVHNRIDLKTEFRIGGADQLWSQGLISLNIKMDQWISFFEEKLRDFSKETGKAIQKTGEAIQQTGSDAIKKTEEVIVKPFNSKSGK